MRFFADNADYYAALRQMPKYSELQAILDSDEPLDVQILPDGSIEAVAPGTPPVEGPRPRVLTISEALEDDY